MKKNIYPFLLIAIPLALIFLAFFERAYVDLVRRSIVVFLIFSVPYCFFVKDPRKGLLIFLAETSLLEGPWKIFSYGMDLKLLVYIIRDLLLYVTFLNFTINKRKILPKEILKEKIPHARLLSLFIFNIILQLFNPRGYSMLNSITGSRLFWEMLPLYWMGFYLMRNKKNLTTFFWLSISFVFFNAIATILQYNWGIERVAQISKGYYAIVYDWGRTLRDATVRPPGLGSDMGFAGALFYQAVPMFIVLFFSVNTRIKGTFKKYIVIAYVFFLLFIGVAGLIFSTSRTEVVLSVIYAIIYIWAMRKSLNRFFVKLILIGLIIYLFVPYTFTKVNLAVKRYETIRNPKILLTTIFEDERGRFLQAFVYPMYYIRHSFLGNGLGRVGPGASLFATPLMVEEATNAENTINLSLTEIGAIGVFIWLLFHIRVIKEGAKILKRIKDKEWKLYLAVPYIGLIVLLVHWQFGQMVIFPVNAAFWFMAGILMGFKYYQPDEYQNS